MLLCWRWRGAGESEPGACRSLPLTRGRVGLECLGAPRQGLTRDLFITRWPGTPRFGFVEPKTAR